MRLRAGGCEAPEDDAEGGMVLPVLPAGVARLWWERLI